MGNFASIAAAGKSIERLLGQAFLDEEPIDAPGARTKAVLASTESFDAKGTESRITPPALSILIYRVDFNKTMRAAWSAVASQDGRAHLPVDLHFLITPWAQNVEYELRILGRAMQCLETTPVISGPMLHRSGDWAANDSVQIVMEDLSTEAVMRTFDSLPGDYRLSVPYIARVVRIDARAARPTPPVATLVTGIAPP